MLVLEDDPRFGPLVCGHLDAAGYATDLASTVAEFREVAALGTHALYLIDLCLPDGDGADLVAQLRAENCMMPVLVVTARSAVRDRVAGLDRGADDYLVKPFNVAELLARVRAMLRRAPSLRSPRLQAGRVVLDCSTGEISCTGRPVPLSPFERRLLQLLIHRVGRVVPKETIQNIVQGAHGESSPNAIEQLVSRLRKSLANSAMGIQLRTVRGLGYVLEERL
jgi:DNA-binding response OmpR family regulator